MKKSFLFCFLICFLLITGCKTTDVSKQDFSLLQQGFEIIQGDIPERRSTWHCVKIDLSQITDDSQIKYYYSKPASVLNFAKKNNCVVAINTTPFYLEQNPQLCTGIIKANGNVLSEPLEQYCALALFWNEDKTLSCKIIENQTEDEIEKYPYAFGGFFVILKDNKIREFKHNNRSRTACGTDETGRYLYLFAITPRFSLTDRQGLTYPECAQILQSLGCTQAMQFDGGHSTAMVVNGKSVEAPLFQRKIPAAIGF